MKSRERNIVRHIKSLSNEVLKMEGLNDKEAQSETLEQLYSACSELLVIASYKNIEVEK